MLDGALYVADDAELAEDHARAQALLERFNSSPHEEQERRLDLLRSLFAALGDGAVIKPTLRCDYGYHISVGDGAFLNYDCVLLDVAAITIGAHCQIGPRVQLLTATHPLDPVARRAGWESAQPIAIGDNVWLGGGAIVCPGVSIGEDTVVGAGSVVTRDLPGGVVAVGAPARILRAITAADRVAVPGAPLPEPPA